VNGGDTIPGKGKNRGGGCLSFFGAAEGGEARKRKTDLWRYFLGGSRSTRNKQREEGKERKRQTKSRRAAKETRENEALKKTNHFSAQRSETKKREFEQKGKGNRNISHKASRLTPKKGWKMPRHKRLGSASTGRDQGGSFLGARAD